MEICKFCGDRDLSKIPYGICFECGNHGPKFVETMYLGYLCSHPSASYQEAEDSTEVKEAIERFHRDICQWHREHGTNKCHCKI